MSGGVPDWQRFANPTALCYNLSGWFTCAPSDWSLSVSKTFRQGWAAPVPLLPIYSSPVHACGAGWKNAPNIPLDSRPVLWHFRGAFLCLRVNKGLSEMLRILAVALSLSLLNLLPVATPPAYAGDTIIKCKIKGVGVRNFKLEDGIWSDKVWGAQEQYRLERMVPETEKQNLKVGGDEMFCMVANVKHRDMVIWGRTILNFEDPSWKMRYRFAKPGQAYVDSAPGGREDATCKAWKD